MSQRDDSQHQGGRERGWHGTVNRSEGLIHVVMLDKRKMLTRLNHKGRDQEPVVKRHRSQMRDPRRRSPPSPVQVPRRNVVSPSSSRKGKRTVRYADGMAGKRGWRKRRLLCNAADRDDLIPHESELTSLWCLSTRTTEESVQRVLQMSVALFHWCYLPREGIDQGSVSCSQQVVELLTGPSHGL